MDFCIFGQTTVSINSGVDDPMPNFLGTLDEVGDAAHPPFPWTVPDGKILCIDCFGVEGTKEPVSALLFWVGDYSVGMTPAQQADYRKVNSTYTCQSPEGSREVFGASVRFPEGTKIHMRLINGTQTAYTLAWYVSGRLEDA